MFQKDFSPEELAGRRRRVLAAIGSDAVALVQGAEKESSHDLFRQTNDFYYLCGVEVPHAYLLLDGRAEACSLFVPHQSQQRKENEGELLSARARCSCPISRSSARRTKASFSQRTTRMRRVC
jgi:Xaa-Pro aminopeptidase